MSIEEENKAMVRRFYDLDNRREKDAQYILIAPECVFHTPYADMSVKQFKKFDSLFYVAFPDIHATIVDIIAEGDMVAFRVSVKGTNTGEFMGNAPTDKKFEITNSNWVRITNSKLVEYWTTSDRYSFMQQIGSIPSQ